MSQKYQDDHFEALELFAEQVFIFLSLLANQRRLNCDELWVLERAVTVMAQVRSDGGVPVLQSIAAAGRCEALPMS